MGFNAILGNASMADIGSLGATGTRMTRKGMPSDYRQRREEAYRQATRNLSHKHRGLAQFRQKLAAYSSKFSKVQQQYMQPLVQLECAITKNFEH